MRSMTFSRVQPATLVRARWISCIILLLVLPSMAGCGAGKSKAEQANDAVQRGLQAHAAGQLDKAADAYEQALDLDPHNKYALFDLGVIEDASSRPNSAENYYQQALAVDPHFAPALYNLAILKAKTGDVQGSIALYRQAVEASPNWAEAHLNLGFALIQEGDRDAGEAELQQAVELNPALTDRIPQSPASTSTAAKPGSDQDPSLDTH